VPAQLVLPLQTDPALGREDFILSDANAGAVALIDSYPDWPAPLAALHGPSGSGKTHLTRVWAARARAHIVDANALDDALLERLPPGPIAIEDVDAASPGPRDSALFSLIERGGPVLLTGREPPPRWPVLLPDLASRFRALLAFALWAPDDRMLCELAQKLFLDRQLRVPETVILRMIVSLERSPAAIRDFVAKLDARALAEKRSINMALVREMLPSNP
jgi:chromosomal replication initiation ATPase DnaA